MIDADAAAARDTWLSDLFAALWPYLRQGVEAQARDSIRSATQSGIPYLDGITLDSLELGTHTPIIESASVSAPNNEPALDVVLRWSIQPHAAVQAGFAPPQATPNVGNDGNSSNRGGPPSAQQGSTRVNPAPRTDTQLKVHTQLDANLRSTIHLPLQPMIEALLPRGVVHKVHEGLLGQPDTDAHKITRHGYNPHEHPDGRPLHPDEALLTDLVEVAWPYIRSMVQDQVWDAVPAVLKSTAPRWLADLALKKFTLGDIPPKLFDIRVYADEHDVVDDVFVDIGFDWRSNFDMELGVTAFPSLLAALPEFLERGAKHLTSIEVGAEDVMLRGRLRLSLRPLLPTLPVIGALRAGLWEMPELHFEVRCVCGHAPPITTTHWSDIKVTAMGGQVALLPMLKTWLFDTVKSAVITPYLAPGGVQIPLAEGVFVPEVYSGVVAIEVIEARHVPKMDLLQLSSPFVEVFLVLPPTKSPVWRERFVLPVQLPQVQKLHCILWDHDDLMADDKIGTATLSLTDLPDDGQEVDSWLSVDDDAAQEAVWRGSKGHRRNQVVKALTAPLQPGSTKSTAMHVKVCCCKGHIMVGRAIIHQVSFRLFDDAFIGVAVRCQEHGVFRVLQRDPGLVDTLEPWQLDLLLSGRVHVTVRAARGLDVQGALPLLSKKTKVEVRVGDELKTTPSRAPTDRGKGIVEWNQDLDLQLAAVQVLEAEARPVVVRVLDDGGHPMGAATVTLPSLLQSKTPLDEPLLLQGATNAAAQLHVALAWRWLLS